MNRLIKFSGFVLFFVLLSCNENKGKTPYTVYDSNGIIYNAPFEGINAFLTYQEKVEKRTDLNNSNSLFYTHNSGSTIQSFAKLDKSGSVIKAELMEVFEDGKQITYIFYFLNDILSMAQIQKNETLNCLNYSIFFNSSQSPIAMYSHKSKISSGSETSAFNLIKNSRSIINEIEKALDRISEIQNQEGRYCLKFIGFNEAYGKKYIEFGNENYSTNLCFIPQEPLVQKIQSNPESYRSKTFNIQFQEITEASGFSYQLLTKITEMH